MAAITLAQSHSGAQELRGVRGHVCPLVSGSALLWSKAGDPLNGRLSITMATGASALGSGPKDSVGVRGEGRVHEGGE